MNEKKSMCYLCELSDTPTQCGIHCKFYEDGLACPFRTPREFWDLNLCVACKNKSDNCGFSGRVVRNKRSGNVVGCFGFEKKKAEEKQCVLKTQQ